MMCPGMLSEKTSAKQGLACGPALEADTANRVEVRAVRTDAVEDHLHVVAGDEQRLWWRRLFFLRPWFLPLTGLFPCVQLLARLMTLTFRA